MIFENRDFFSAFRKRPCFLKSGDAAAIWAKISVNLDHLLHNIIFTISSNFNNLIFNK